MKNIISGLMKKYGETVLLGIGDEKFTVTAFVQPVTSLDKRYYRNSVTEVGLGSQMRYLYLGPPEYDVTKCDCIICRSREFEVLSSEMIYGGGVPLYCWAVLRGYA